LPLDRAKTTSDSITVLDKRVLSDYGGKLLPRAIGYSVSAIDHFFRGRIEIASPDRFVMGRAEYQEGNTSSFDTLRLKVRNASPADQETSGAGTLWAVVHYRTSSENLFDNPGAEISADPVYAVSSPIQISLSRSFQERRFEFPDGGIPTNAADVWLVVVYQGELGGEPGAVLVGGKDLPEPQPIDYGNMTDYDCVDGQFHYVANLAPDDPARDLDGGEHLNGPFVERQQYRKVSDYSGAAYLPTSTFYDFFVAESQVLAGPTIGEGVTPTTRFVVLHDAEQIWRVQRTGEIRNESNVLLSQNQVRTLSTYAVRNDYLRALDARRYTANQTYRGINGFGLIFLVPRPAAQYNACVEALRNEPPDFTRIPGTLAPEE
jgi:hypothetical protein